MKAVLLNLRKFHSTKKEKDYCVIQVLRDITQGERNRGYFGKQVSEEHFLPDNLVNKLDNSHVGKNLDLVYEVIGGKANLVDINIL